MQPVITVHSPSLGQLEFSDSYIIGILPEERKVRQQLSCSLTVSLPLPQSSCESVLAGAVAKTNLESSAALLHSMLTFGQYPLLEHALGHGLMALSRQWQAIFASSSELRTLREGSECTLSLTIAKPAALAYLATPAVRAQRCWPIDPQSTGQQSCPKSSGEAAHLHLPVAGIGMFQFVEEGKVTTELTSSKAALCRFSTGSSTGSSAESGRGVRGAEKVWQQGCHQLWWQPHDLEA